MNLGESPGIDVSVVIVTWNTRAVTLACLRSLEKWCSLERTEIIVVDNASGDGTSEAIRRDYPQVRLIENEANVGFARANNQGLECARGRFFLLLNSDTELRDDAVSATLAFAESRPEAGIVGCRAIGTDGRQQPTLFRFTRLRQLALNVVIPNQWMLRSSLFGQARYIGIDLDSVQEVEVLTGCFMLVRREVYFRVGGLDPSFFMYGEEVEWCFRVRRAGWRVLYFPGASIVHHGGVSTAQCAAAMGLEQTKGQLLFLYKTRGAGTMWAANLLMLIRDLPRIVLWTVLWPVPSVRMQNVRKFLEASVKRFPLLCGNLARWRWHGLAEQSKGAGANVAEQSAAS